MTDNAAPVPEHGTVFLSIGALKQMLAWSLLCLGILETKDQDFDIDVRKDGVIVRTGKK